jgi:hypothetical protein
VRILGIGSEGSASQLVLLVSSLALGGWSAVNLEDAGDELNPASGGSRVGVAEEGG